MGKINAQFLVFTVLFPTKEFFEITMILACLSVGPISAFEETDQRLRNLVRGVSH